jgi:predicted RNA-binding Zn-ribbon protein involved in translation (DUF1610 family)
MLAPVLPCPKCGALLWWKRKKTSLWTLWRCGKCGYFERERMDD